MTEAGRVVAGSARGTRLRAPGPGTRPLADRVKQTLFAILEPDLAGATVLDLFAGSGAGGIEALSRGAARVVFVERDAMAARVIAENLALTRLSDRGHVARADVIAYLKNRAAPDGPFDIVLVDPPYAETALMDAALRLLGAGEAHLLTPGSWVVAKHFWRTPPPAVVGLLASVRTRRFGETALMFYRPGGEALADPGSGEDATQVPPAGEAPGGSQ
ncbi:MAG: 16S rRNA (guanine(966)-N(2))-methyltransferase RsmD [Candidatus Limnocylindrales bacterium]